MPAIALATAVGVGVEFVLQAAGFGRVRLFGLRRAILVGRALRVRRRQSVGHLLVAVESALRDASFSPLRGGLRCGLRKAW